MEFTEPIQDISEDLATGETRVRHRVLIVDDESPLRFLLKEYLAKLNYEILLADSADSALKVLKEEKPEVIVTDVRMPGKSGIDLLKEVREINTDIPVIVITGFPNVDDAIQALQADTFDYLIKPFNLSELHEKIEDALETRKMAQDNSNLREIASLHDITNKLVSCNNLDELLTIMLDESLEISKADGGSIELTDQSRKNLVIIRSCQVKNKKKVSPIDDDKEWEVSKWVFKHKKALLIKDDRTIPETDINISGRQGLKSSLSLPLISADQCIGVLNLNRKDEDFIDQDLNLIQIFAAQAGAAISNAKTYGSLMRKLRGLTLISEFTDKLMEKIERKDILSFLFYSVCRHFPLYTDFISILFLHEDDAPQFAYWSRFNINRTYAEEVFKSLSESIGKEERLKKSMQNIPFERYHLGQYEVPLENMKQCKFSQVFPIVMQDNNLGALFVGSKSEQVMPLETQEQISSLLSQVAIALINARLYENMKENYFKTIKALATAVDAKDTYTGGHSEAVSKYAFMVARKMGMDPEKLSVIKDAGLLHDVGKIGIPGHILNKPGLLTSEEFNSVMKTHPAMGANIVKEVPFLQEFYPLILYHHERIDGSGYPAGMTGGQIPLGAKILAVADAYSAMTSNRPYRKSLGRVEACRRLREGKGTQFDADIVDIFLKTLEEEEPMANG